MEFPEIQQSASDAIDRSRNTRQKTVLLTHVSVTRRERSVTLRAKNVELGCAMHDTCVRLTARIEEQKEPESLQAKERKPVAKQKAILPR